MSEQQQASFSGWARVEVMGHQTHIGFVRTEVYGAAVMFRIDQPEFPEREFTLTRPAYVEGRWTDAGAKVKRQPIKGCTVLVGAGSIYRIIPCSEEAARLAIEEIERAELKLIEPPPGRTLAAPFPVDQEDEEEDDEDNEEDEEDNDEDDEDAGRISSTRQKFYSPDPIPEKFDYSEGPKPLEAERI